MNKKIALWLTLFTFITSFSDAEENKGPWLLDVWGSSANDVFVVGSKTNSLPGPAVVYHYNGKIWKEIGPHIADAFMSVWGTSSTNVCAVSYDGKIFHYDGKQWTIVMNGELADGLRKIWGSSSSNIYAVGYIDESGYRGVVLHYDGNLWTRIYTGTLHSSISEVWGDSNSNVFVIENRFESNVYNRAFLHFNGYSWTTLPSVPGSVAGIWGTSPTDIYVHGVYGEFYKYNGSYWSVIRDRMYDNDGGGIWGSSAIDIFLVGDYPYPYELEKKIFHFNGSKLQAMDYPTNKGLGAVWGTSNSNVYAVGGDGLIVHYNGTNWSLVDIFISNTFPIPDINSDNAVDLSDLIIALKIISGTDNSTTVINKAADVNNDNKIGLEEAIFVLKDMAMQ